MKNPRTSTFSSRLKTRRPSARKSSAVSSKNIKKRASRITKPSSPTSRSKKRKSRKESTQEVISYTKRLIPLVKENIKTQTMSATISAGGGIPRMEDDSVTADYSNFLSDLMTSPKNPDLKFSPFSAGSGTVS
jgi:BRCT domain type II-containing protein